MPQDLDRRLGPEDYAFLLLENEREPMNIGSIAVFEGDLPYHEFVDNIASKLHLIPRYTQVVVPAPLNVGRPTWESDPYFDISRHIHEVWLSRPGSQQQLLDLAADIYARRLERSKPLWECYIIHGLEGGNSAIVTVMHHCMVDGVGGVELAMVMLDTVPNPQRVTYSEPPERPMIPSSPRLLIDAIFDDLAEWLDRSIAWQQRMTSLFATTREPGWMHSMRRGLEAALPFLLLPVEKTGFNQKLSGRRKVAGTTFSFEEFRAVKSRIGGTVNDVGTAMVGAAVGRYLAERGERTERRELRVLAPMNVRAPDQSGRLGNRITFLLVEVPIWEMDPVERVRAVSQQMTHLKTEGAGGGIEMLGMELLSLPTPLLKGVTALGSPPQTIANMVCTNVPGPVMPLYSIGHRLLSHYALAPISWEMAINCAITTYHREITFTWVVDPEAVTDVDRLNGLLGEAYQEMRAAAGIEPGPPLEEATAAEAEVSEARIA
jgi:WS/DGAT/MGAT family acyltransferase